MGIESAFESHLLINGVDKCLLRTIVRALSLLMKLFQCTSARVEHLSGTGRLSITYGAAV